MFVALDREICIFILLVVTSVLLCGNESPWKGSLFMYLAYMHLASSPGPFEMGLGTRLTCTKHHCMLRAFTLLYCKSKEEMPKMGI